MSEQLARDAFGLVKPVPGYWRLGAMLKHVIGVHTFIPTVDIEMDGHLVKRMTRVTECAFCKERR